MLHDAEGCVAELRTGGQWYVGSTRLWLVREAAPTRAGKTTSDGTFCPDGLARLLPSDWVTVPSSCGGLVTFLNQRVSALEQSVLGGRVAPYAGPRHHTSGGLVVPEVV